MSPKEIVEEVREIKQDLEIQVYTMDYLEIKENQKYIINKSLKKLKKKAKGNKSYQYELTDKKQLNEFKTTIKEHFKYILKDCDKPLETNFKDYKGEIKQLEAFCDFYDYAIGVVNKKLKKKQLVRENLEHYFQKIKKEIHCTN